MAAVRGLCVELSWSRLSFGWHWPSLGHSHKRGNPTQGRMQGKESPSRQGQDPGRNCSAAQTSLLDTGTGTAWADEQENADNPPNLLFLAL